MVVRTDDEVGMGETTKIKPGIPLPLGYSIQPGEPVESVSGYSNARQRFTKELVTLHQTFSLPSLKQEKKKNFLSISPPACFGPLGRETTGESKNPVHFPR